ncbi:MAG: DHH family phosphoesterase [Myxococcales bacterium]|nr:DHH family phosphoesterase [Myxococcales bacterium]
MQRLTKTPFEPWFIERLQAARKIALMTHVDPDADGLGSQVAFCLAARQAGVDVVIVNEDPCPERYAWIDPRNVVQRFEDGVSSLDGVDLGLIFDAHEISRARRPAEALRAAGVDVWVVDHHAVAPHTEVTGCVATDFSSTGELCFRLLERLGWALDADAALGIYGAMSFDTGSFRFLRNQPNTMRVAAALLDTGLDANPIQEALWASRPFDETVLLGRICSQIQVSDDGSVAWAVVPEEMLEGLAVGRDAIGEAMPMVIGIAGVQAAAMFKPGRAPGQWKVSLRSKTAVTIGHIAQGRGGGGHAHAAGCSVQGDLDGHVQAVIGEMLAATAKAGFAS